MDTALAQKFPFILDRKLAKANCTGNHVCTSCDTVVIDSYILNSKSKNGRQADNNFYEKLMVALIWCPNVF